MVRDELVKRQVEVDQETARGALQLISGEGTYLTCNTFDPECEYRGNDYYDPSRTHAIPVDDAAVIDKLRQLSR
jgi:hypothetical protein